MACDAYVFITPLANVGAWSFCVWLRQCARSGAVRVRESCKDCWDMMHCAPCATQCWRPHMGIAGRVGHLQLTNPSLQKLDSLWSVSEKRPRTDTSLFHLNLKYSSSPFQLRHTVQYQAMASLSSSSCQVCISYFCI